MKRISTTPTVLPAADMGAVGKAWDEVSASFDRFCLAAGVDALGAMMEKDAEEVCGARHARGEGRRGHRWGRTQGKIGFHAGKVSVERPRVRDLDRSLSVRAVTGLTQDEEPGRPSDAAGARGTDRVLASS